MFDNPFSMIVAIVLIVMIANVLKAKYRGEGSSHTNGDHAGADAATKNVMNDIQNLRERIQVLERVITDQRESNDLSIEIEKLRNQ